MTPEKLPGRIGWRVPVLLLTLFLCACGGSGGGSGTGALPVRPASGSLDNSFGGTGYITHDNAAGGSSFDEGFAVAIDGSGRILVAGYSRNPSGYDGMALWRFLPDGTLDNSFGGKGYVTHDNTAGGGWEEGRSIAIDGNGRIVVAGFTGPLDWRRADMAVWRFMPDGTVDNSFGGKGYVVHDNAAGGGGPDHGRAVAIDGEGRIVVAGDSSRSMGPAALTIWRYNPDGSLDNSFGGKGYVTHDNAVGADKDVFALSVAIDETGRIVAAGRSSDWDDFSASVMILWRFDHEGNIDTSFGGKGSVIQDNTAGGGGYDVGASLAIDGSGRILVTGHSRSPSGNEDMALWRFNEDGTLDNTFGGKGFVTYDNTEGAGLDIAIDGSGRIVVAGRTYNPEPYQWDVGMTLWRYMPDGTLDNSFGEKGFVTQTNTVNGAGHDYGNSVAIDGSGRIVVGGATWKSSGETDVAVWRFFP